MPAIFDMLLMTAAILFVLYCGGTACNDVRQIHAARAENDARRQWHHEHPDDPGPDAEVDAYSKAAATTILNQNAWRFTGRRITKGLKRWLRANLMKHAWQRRMDTVLGRPERPKPDA